MPRFITDFNNKTTNLIEFKLLKSKFIHDISFLSKSWNLIRRLTDFISNSFSALPARAFANCFCQISRRHCINFWAAIKVQLPGCTIRFASHMIKPVINDCTDDSKRSSRGRSLTPQMRSLITANSSASFKHLLLLDDIKLWVNAGATYVKTCKVKYFIVCKAQFLNCT